MPNFMSYEDLVDLDNNYGGRCRACDADAYNVEPDARNYECEECGENEVFGAAEWAFEGLVE